MRGADPSEVMLEEREAFGDPSSPGSPLDQQTMELDVQALLAAESMGRPAPEISASAGAAAAEAAAQRAGDPEDLLEWEVPDGRERITDRRRTRGRAAAHGPVPARR